MFGTLMAVCGFILSAVAPNPTFMFVSYSIITGKERFINYAYNAQCPQFIISHAVFTTFS